MAPHVPALLFFLLLTRRKAALMGWRMAGSWLYLERKGGKWRSPEEAGQHRVSRNRDGTVTVSVCRGRRGPGAPTAFLSSHRRFPSAPGAEAPHPPGHGRPSSVQLRENPALVIRKTWPRAQAGAGLPSPCDNGARALSRQGPSGPCRPLRSAAPPAEAGRRHDGAAEAGGLRACPNMAAPSQITGMEVKTSEDHLKVRKMKKKVLRKQIRAQHTLMRHEGIECISHATQSLVIANAGLGNGMSRHQLLRIVEEYGLVETLLMPPNKPYSFVKYGTTEEAKKAFDALNGKEVTLEDFDQNIILYVNFVEKVLWQNVVPTSLPPGLMIIEKIISPEEERRMLESIDWTGDEDTRNAQKTLKYRRVKHFGYEFCYDNNNVDKDKPLPGGLPEICNLLLDKWLKQGYIKHEPDQLTVNQYEPGQGIPPHIDTHSAFEDEIISLSLGAKIVMDFKHPDGHTVAVMLPRCSLLVMAGESRYLWTHGITPRKYDVIQASELGQKVRKITADVGDLTLNRRETRTSFTFRKVRRSPCNCIYPSVCDSQKGQQRQEQPSFPHSQMEALKLEQEYVHKVYEEIATHFSSTRHSPWPRIVEFLRSLPKGSIVADVGCGNGKYLGINKDLYMVGCDRSKNLVDICGEKNFQAFVCDALSVPILSGSCDACISIAVIHHFSTAERRLATIRELVRLLRPGGTALIYVWAMEQEYKNQKSKYLKEKNGSEDKEEEIDSGTAQRPLCDPMPDSSSQVLARSDQPLNDSKDEGCDAKPVADSRLPVHTNRTSFHSQDLLVPWHLKGGTKKKGEGVDTVLLPAGSKESQELSPVFHRYYHVFCEGELEAVCRTLDCVRVQKSYYDQGNWCVVLEKL